MAGFSGRVVDHARERALMPHWWCMPLIVTLAGRNLCALFSFLVEPG